MKAITTTYCGKPQKKGTSMTQTITISPELIEMARAAEACADALNWLCERPRTLAELASEQKEWAEWAATEIPQLPESVREELQAIGAGRSWYRDGQRHRDDGPAVVWANGRQEWWRDGQRQRDDGPAVVWADGCQEWHRNGQLHRDDGDDDGHFVPKGEK